MAMDAYTSMAAGHVPLVFVSLAIAVMGYSAYSSLTSSSSVDRLTYGLPWINAEKGALFTFRKFKTGAGDLTKVLEKGYREFSKTGKLFVLPRFPASLIVLPATDVKWLVDQPDSLVNAKEMQRNTLQIDALLGDRSIVDHGLQENVIRRDLTRQAGVLIPETYEELGAGIDEYFGSDTTSFNDVAVFKVISKVVSRTSNRIFVGPQLCRNQDYLNHVGAFSRTIALGGMVLRLIPRLLRPVLGLVVVLPTRWQQYKIYKHLKPFILQRIAVIKAAEASGASDSIPNDFTTWLLREASKSPDPTEQTPEKIAVRLMVLNFAAIHTSTFGATNVLFDLYSSPTAESDVQELRAEIEQVYNENGRKWDKAAVAKLVKTDSAFRESLRISTFMVHALDRVVIHPEGVTAKNGTHFPQGSKLAVPSRPIHLDDAYYPDAKVYHPFRFCKPGERGLDTVTTTDTFLTFGHGKHACPGRHFAALEIKMLLAYVIMNYDVKCLKGRPANKHMAGTVLPPMKATLAAKRRK